MVCLGQPNKGIRGQHNGLSQLLFTNVLQVRGLSKSVVQETKSVAPRTEVPSGGPVKWPTLLCNRIKLSFVGVHYKRTRLTDKTFQSLATLQSYILLQRVGILRSDNYNSSLTLGLRCRGNGHTGPPTVAYATVSSKCTHQISSYAFCKLYLDGWSVGR